MIFEHHSGEQPTKIFRVFAWKHKKMKILTTNSNFVWHFVIQITFNWNNPNVHRRIGILWTGAYIRLKVNSVSQDQANFYQTQLFVNQK